MNELQLFNHDAFGQLRTHIDESGTTWFCGKDITAALEYGSTNMPTIFAAVPDEWKGSRQIATPGGTQEMLCLTEQGVYFFLGRSDKPKALPYQKWVAGEVIPSIRKHGGYLTPEKVEEALLNPDTLIRLATDLKAERERRVALEAKVEADRPKVLFTESVEAASNSILIGAYAGLLRQNGLPMGQNRLFARFREDGWLNKNGERRNMPTQKAMEMGLFEIKERTVNNPDGTIRTTLTPKLTGKGQVYFMSRLLNGAA